MAREYARVRLSIWADSDFRHLSDPAQALYFRLITSPTMNLAGVADWRPKRIAALTSGMTAKAVEGAARELTAGGYIVIDEDTEEVLVRSFIRHDGLIKTPNIAAAMCKDYAGTASETIRGVIVHELHRLHDDEPEMKGWVVASKLLTEPSVNPFGMPSGNPSGKASPNASGDASDIPHPSTLNQQPTASPKRATSLPADWAPTQEHIERAALDGIDLDREVIKFRAWADEGNTSKSWNGRFTRWLMQAADYAKERPGNVRPLRPSTAGIDSLPLDQQIALYEKGQWS